MTARHLNAAALASAIGVILLAETTFAQLSPGELAAPHAALEGLSNCTSCHELGEGPSATKCLACHTEITAGLERRTGLHHKAVTVERQLCFTCHSDHGGRDMPLIRWSESELTFDHAIAKYELKGKHAVLECRQCHKAAFVSVEFVIAHKNINLASTFLGLDRTCLTCHHDEHREQLSNDCISCHSFERWSPAPLFEHSATTFQLRGAHANVLCVKCHAIVPGGDKWTPDGTVDSAYSQYSLSAFQGCASCHADRHNPTLGDQCQTCHTQERWKPAIGFDHSATKFPLTGKHESVACEKCHTSSNSALAGDSDEGSPLARFAGVIAENCNSCHIDVHDGRLGGNCKPCHSTASWNAIPDGAFTHSQTAYPLVGKHQSVTCEKCHKQGESAATGSRYRVAEFTVCESCHADSHRRQFALRSDGGRCDACHSEQGFSPALYTADDHRQTAFALNGAHLAQPCVYCHKPESADENGSYIAFKFERQDCKFCHTDPHAGQFSGSAPSKICEDCHTESSWRQLAFDHNADSKYRLEGAHANTQCGLCHKSETIAGFSTVRYRPLPNECRDCHSLETLELLKSE